MLAKAVKSVQANNNKASVANLLAMYTEATVSKGECEKKFLLFMQDMASSNNN
jgi:hypothetical protein